jgi:hypothetical protein
MRRAIALVLLTLGSLTTIGFAPLGDSPTLRDCANGVCSMRMTAPQLLATTEKLVLDRRFEEARPLLAALALAPELSMEHHFLEGYVAAETGALDTAAKEFRAVLRDRPDMTRARLELARVLMLQGKDSAADHHYRLAAETGDLPPEIERTIREQRGVIRNRKNWYFNFDFGLAPDSNINSATSASTIDTTLQYNGKPVEMVLGPDARRKSGIGQTLGAQGGVRLRLDDGLAMVIDGDGQIINQPGKRSDDVTALLAAGPELTMTNGTRIGIQAVGVGRWYGGTAAQKGGGLRVNYQRDLSAGQRIGLRLDARHTDSDFSRAYGGWQFAGSGTYERVINHTMVASASGFVRREELRSRAYSSTEGGFNAGIGGELPYGLNGGLSAGISRAIFDAAIPFLSTEPRKDWRLNGRAYMGLRSVRVLGFSPSVTYSFARNASNIRLYDTTRHRFQFELARYF